MINRRENLTDKVTKLVIYLLCDNDLLSMLIKIKNFMYILFWYIIGNIVFQ